MLSKSPIKTPLSLDDTVNFLRAAGEPTRMRLLVLLSRADLTVSEVTEIMGQSQPRVSRHLRLLVEAGLAERYSEGAWAYFRAKDQGASAEFRRFVLSQIDVDDEVLIGDLERLDKIKQRRADRAAEYFSENASSWDTIRSLQMPEELVEARMHEIIGEEQVDNLLDLGTGTGRMLELFAPIAERAIGLDASKDMLAIARANLQKDDFSHVQVRQGNVYQLPMGRDTFDLVILHQVLHFLDDPAAVLREVTKVLRPAGRLLIVDFASHGLDFLREQHAHQRLGFSHDQMNAWLAECGLEVSHVSDLQPEPAEDEKLTVSFWLAHDQRVLMAEPINPLPKEAIA